MSRDLVLPSLLLCQVVKKGNSYIPESSSSIRKTPSYPKAQVARGCFHNAVSRCADKEQSLQAQPRDALCLLPLHFISAGTFASHLLSFYPTAECADCSQVKDLTKTINHLSSCPSLPYGFATRETAQFR